jgi:hypothetical protein
MSRLAAIDYLRTPPNAPWKWEEGGRVLAWNDGTTVLFREELNVLVERLAPAGLPLFPALVLLLAACRGKVPELSSTVDAAGPGRGPFLLALQTRQHQQAVEEFTRVIRLPPELIARASGKALLAEAVFELSTRLSAAESASIARGLCEAWGENELGSHPVDAVPLDAGRMLQLVFEGLRRHTAETLTRRLRTGLDALPAAAPELVLPREERSRRLLHALKTDDDHAGLALVVSDLMAALRLPRTLTRMDETAADGVSDIGNRGPLDRLVLSELAHDDLTLATRVALNEALYLRREPPAQRPQRSLAVLLDAGVRMWGVPRVLGAAAALALISRHPHGCDALAWRAEGRSLVPVDLLEKTGLEGHLSALGTDVHPGAALPALSAVLAEHREVDAVIITHRDAIADPAFQAQLAQVEFERGFLVLVERDGLVELHALPWGSPRPLGKTQVDVAKLFPRSEARRSPASLVADERVNDLPAIFRDRLFPLLLPVNAKMTLVAPAGDGGGLCVTSDNRLLHWGKRDWGARQFATELPAGRACWLHFDPSGRAILVKGRGGDGRMSVMIAHANGEGPRIARFTGPHHPMTACVAQHVVLVVLNTRIVTVELGSGEVLAETPVPADLRWINGCYFAGARELCFLSWDGAAARWGSLAVGRQAPPHEVLTVFDRDGVGAWVVLRDGRLLTPTGSEFLHTGFRLDHAIVVDGGRRVAVRRAGDEAWHVMALESKIVRPAPNHASACAPTPVLPPTRSLQTRFASVWAAPGQPLRLRKALGKSGKWLELFFNPGGALRLVESAVADAMLQNEARMFSPVTTSAGLGCRLQLARWPGGSCAWLDSRGLLHLRSHDSSVPEITLALCSQAELAGWSSDGDRCGPAFFHGDRVTGAGPRFKELLAEFCTRIC